MPKAGWRITALMLAVIATLPLIAACGSVETTDFAQNYTVGTDALLVIDSGNGDVHVVVGAPGDIQPGTVRVEALLEDVDNLLFSVTEGENELRVLSEREGSGFLSGTPRSTITLYVPGGTNPLRITTGNGAVYIGDIHADAHANSGNGRIVLGAATGNFNFTAGNGRVEIDGAEGSFVVTTGNGGIDFAGTFDDGSENSFTTGNGDVSLKISGELNLSIDAETDGGRLNSTFQLDNVVHSATGTLEGVVGTGATSLLVRSGNGGIDLSSE